MLAMSILVLREGLFHKIKASKKQDLYALEAETPYIKKINSFTRRLWKKK